MGNRNFRLALMGCTAIAALAFTQAQAQQAAATADGPVLNKIVVKTGAKTAGQKLEKGAADTPLASETTADDIRKKEISSIRDLGNTTEPGVDYVSPRNGAQGGMFIRGLGGARIATLIDDIPIPYLETLTRTGSASPTTGVNDSSDSFDFSSLSSVDIVRGSDSSRIGPGALAGAVLLKTLEPEDLIRDGKDWGAVVKTSYDSADKSFGVSAAGAKKVGATSVLLQGSYKRGHEFDNNANGDLIGSARTKANPADSNQRSVLFKVRHDIEGGHRIGFTAERFKRNVDTDLNTLQAATFTAATAGSTFRVGDYLGYDDTTRDRISLDYEYEAPEAGGLIDAARLTPYWQRLSKASGSYGSRNSGAAYARHNATRESAFGVTGGLISTFETGSLDHTVRLGGNVQFFQYDQYLGALAGVSTTGSQSDVPDVDGKRFGIYVDDEIAFGDSGFRLTPGLRFDWYDYKPKLDAAFAANTGYGRFGLPAGQDGARLSPKLLASYNLTPEWQVFAQWSMSYRAPTVAELYSNFTNITGGYAVLGNPALKAETGNGFEIGTSYEADDLSGKLTLFHNNYRNFIDDTSLYTNAYPAGYYPQGFLLNSWANRNRVRISGIEAKARKDFANGIFVHGSLALAYGKDQDTGEFIRSVAPVKSILGVGYEQETWGVDLSAIFSGGMRDDKVASTYDAPGYGVANLTGWWEPEQVEGLRIQAGVYNIFDKTYWNAVGVRDLNPNSVSSTNQPMAYYAEPGRSFKISLTKKF